MMAFGIIGFLMRMMRYPMAPLILGIILGGMIDQNLAALPGPASSATRRRS